MAGDIAPVEDARSPKTEDGGLHVSRFASSAGDTFSAIPMSSHSITDTVSVWQNASDESDVTWYQV